ncbi:sugar kinase [Paenibacillus sp.]|uniref:carbohydrate kinase family protein n=1 Tax=Paenibacillus sp. TaxID=58172 RepID=UPI002812265E|nr:sugar kinase [Paenibacillus sp.]
MNKIVYVLGELNVDLIMTGDDVAPEWNREKLVNSFDMALGSSSAITACGLAGLGLDVRMVSVVGGDEIGAFCIERLKEKGVSVEHVVALEAEKTGVTLSLSTMRDRALLTYMGTISMLRPEHLPERMFEEADHIHFGSYFLQESMRPHWFALFRRAKERGITTSFDTGWDPGERWYKDEISQLLAVTDYFVPSEDEIMNIFGGASLYETLDAVPAYPGRIAVKCGARGAVLAGPGKERIVVGPFPVEPIDTTGAGDSFNAGFIYASLAGREGKEALRFACACGALATTRIGGASGVPSLQDVEAMLRSSN